MLGECWELVGCHWGALGTSLHAHTAGAESCRLPALITDPAASVRQHQ